MKEKLEDLIKNIEAECDILINWNTTEVYQKMPAIFQQFSEVITGLFGLKGTYPLTLEESDLQQMMGNLEIALQRKDNVLLLDALFYDILPRLKEYKEAISS